MTKSTDSGFKQYFNGNTARKLGQKICAVYPGFDTETYAAEVDRQVADKELKARVLVLAQGLRQHLPQDYPQAAAILVAILDAPLEPGQGMFNDGWYLMAVARFVEEYGLDHPAESLDALREITRRHTAEFAIRPFFDRHYDLTLATVNQWATHTCAHVRRAASEGCRPRLPWGRVLNVFVNNPQPVLEILETLRSDPSAYVRKSVANNLNDIARDHPEQVLATAQRWLRESPTTETAWTVRHALRTLIKQGNAQALQMTGASGGEHMSIKKLQLSPAAITLGNSIILRFDIHNNDRQAHTAVIDYAVHHVRRNGKTIAKVFKLARLTLGPGEKRTIEKRHPIQPVTTRKYYPGKHKVDIQVNGRIAAETAFELMV